MPSTIDKENKKKMVIGLLGIAVAAVVQDRLADAIQIIATKSKRTINPLGVELAMEGRYEIIKCHNDSKTRMF